MPVGRTHARVLAGAAGASADAADHRVSEAASPFAAGIPGKNVGIALDHDPASGRALAAAVPLVLHRAHPSAARGRRGDLRGHGRGPARRAAVPT